MRDIANRSLLRCCSNNGSATNMVSLLAIITICILSDKVVAQKVDITKPLTTITFGNLVADDVVPNINDNKSNNNTKTNATSVNSTTVVISNLTSTHSNETKHGNSTTNSSALEFKPVVPVKVRPLMTNTQSCSSLLSKLDLDKNGFIDRHSEFPSLLGKLVTTEANCNKSKPVLHEYTAANIARDINATALVNITNTTTKKTHSIVEPVQSIYDVAYDRLSCLWCQFQAGLKRTETDVFANSTNETLVDEYCCNPSSARTRTIRLPDSAVTVSFGADVNAMYSQYLCTLIGSTVETTCKKLDAEIQKNKTDAQAAAAAAAKAKAEADAIAAQAEADQLKAIEEAEAKKRAERNKWLEHLADNWLLIGILWGVLLLFLCFGYLCCRMRVQKSRNELVTTSNSDEIEKVVIPSNNKSMSLNNDGNTSDSTNNSNHMKNKKTAIPKSSVSTRSSRTSGSASTSRRSQRVVSLLSPDTSTTVAVQSSTVDNNNNKKVSIFNIPSPPCVHLLHIPESEDPMIDIVGTKSLLTDIPLGTNDPVPVPIIDTDQNELARTCSSSSNGSGRSSTSQRSSSSGRRMRQNSDIRAMITVDTDGNNRTLSTATTTVATTTVDNDESIQPVPTTDIMVGSGNDNQNGEVEPTTPTSEPASSSLFDRIGFLFSSIPGTINDFGMNGKTDAVPASTDNGTALISPIRSRSWQLNESGHTMDNSDTGIEGQKNETSSQVMSKILLRANDHPWSVVSSKVDDQGELVKPIDSADTNKTSTVTSNGSNQSYDDEAWSTPLDKSPSFRSGYYHNDSSDDDESNRKGRSEYNDDSKKQQIKSTPVNDDDQIVDTQMSALAPAVANKSSTEVTTPVSPGKGGIIIM